MIRRWLPPIVFGVVLMGIAWHETLVETPRFLMRTAVSRLSGGAGINTMFHAPLADADARAIVRPSPDLAYSSCPFDLTKGPLLIDVAPVPAQYWSLSVFDARTDTALVRNNLQAGGKPMHIALIGEGGGQAPPGYEPVPVKGARGIALVRILIDDRAKFAAIDAARRASNCHPVNPS